VSENCTREKSKIESIVIKNYTGLSTEVKPLRSLGNNVLNGSYLREVDTEKVWCYNLSDDQWYSIGPKIDKTTHAVETISVPHYEIHNESAYYAVRSGLGDDTDTVEVRIQTPDSLKRAHMTITIDAALAATAALWKATTMTHEAGNLIIPMNRDHDSSKTSGLIICHTPGGSQAGDPNITRYIGSATVSGKADVGGSGGSRGEFKLSRNVAYLIRITSRADANATSILLDWYEHTDKV